MAYVDASSSHAEASAIPQGTQAATYFVFGSGSNDFGASSQSLTATPSATAVAATGGSAGASGTGSNASALPQYLPGAAGGFDTQTILLLALALAAGIFIAKRF